MAADGVETERAVWTRPAPPSPSAPLAERKAWADKFLPEFFDRTGGEWPVPPEAIGADCGAFSGRRWRQEFADCVRDPQGFAEYAEREIAAYNERGA